MQKRVFFLLCLAVLSSSPSFAFADAPSVGVDLNLVIGHQKQSSQQNTALPNVPVPMFSLRIPEKRFALFAEGVPPIGPVTYGDGASNTQATKISYMLGEAQYRLPGDRFTFGVGTTLVNQATFYNRRYTLVNEQSSRVAGLRFSFAARVENRIGASTELSVGVSPSMHGLQYSRFAYPLKACRPFRGCTTLRGVDDAEYASLVDVRAARGQRFGRYTLRYGVRYINYSARFPNGWAADRERLVMPFVGLQVPLR